MLAGLESGIQKQIGITHHGGDGIVQFMRCAAYQLADRCQLFGFGDLRLQTLQIDDGLLRLVEQAEQFEIKQTLTHENHYAHE